MFPYFRLQCRFKLCRSVNCISRRASKFVLGSCNDGIEDVDATLSNPLKLGGGNEGLLHKNYSKAKEARRELLTAFCKIVTIFRDASELSA
jgi:hypothetical protein